MGCDIHMAVEVRDDGAWRSADHWSAGDIVNEIYNDRSYSVFSILAGVRNNYGIKPISEPRGAPADASDEVKAWITEWNGYGHSHSYLSLRELLDHDWSTPIHVDGWLNLKGWGTLACVGRPTSWSGAISGAGIVHHEQTDFERAQNRLYKTHEKPWDLYHNDQGAVDRFVAELGDPPNSQPVVHARWRVPQTEYAKNFIVEVIPKLWKIGNGRADDMRIVFLFDN